MVSANNGYPDILNNLSNYTSVSDLTMYRLRKHDKSSTFYIYEVSVVVDAQTLL